jgi:predicted nucleic acid-binding protein
LRELFEHIYIPPAVYFEVVEMGKGRTGAIAIKEANWIECVTVKDSWMMKFRQLNLDVGEAEAIALASEKQADFIIWDDRKAKKTALKLSLPVIGTIAVLKKAE